MMMRNLIETFAFASRLVEPHRRSGLMQGQKSIANELGLEGRPSNFVPPIKGLVHETMHETKLSCSSPEDVA